MPTANEDIIDGLLVQHQQIKLLFGQVDGASGAHKQELFNALVALLAVHESVEESLVHPLAQRKISNGEAVVEARLAEEQDAKAALARLYEMGVDGPGFAVEFAALRDAVTAHAEAEEELEFVELREVVDPDQLTKMTAVMAVAQAMAPTRPHPDVPSGPAANLLVGPPLAVFDRVRDILRDATNKGMEAAS